MLYSGFMGVDPNTTTTSTSASASTPRATTTGRRRPAGELNLVGSTPTQEDFHRPHYNHNHGQNHNEMVHARRTSSPGGGAGGARKLSYSDVYDDEEDSTFDDLPLGKVNPFGMKDEVDEVVYAYALKIA